MRSAVGRLVGALNDRLNPPPPEPPPPEVPITQPAVYSAWESLIPPREMWIGPYDPLVHFARWPFEYRVYLPLLCGLCEDSAVLELGCGYGGTTIGLLEYLQPSARYEGLDIRPEPIVWAQEHIHAAYPAYNFTLADLHHSAYNPTGRQAPETYRFPYDDASFDVAFAASLFTHLLPTTLANYFRQTGRVLRPGGRCLFSFFILDYYRGPGTAVLDFYDFGVPVADGMAAVRDAERPDMLVAHSTTSIERAAHDAGLRTVDVIPGYWSRTHKRTVNEQDLVVLERP